MRIIGKAYLSLFMLLFNAILIAENSFEIKVLDYFDTPLREVQVGVPFQIHIIINGAQEVSKIDFAPSKNIYHLIDLGAVKSLSSFNGVNKRSAVYKYSARIDQVGHYDLGPILIWHQQNLLQKLTLELDVLDKKLDASKRPNVELKANVTQVYVGERFNLKLIFRVDKIQLTMPSLNFTQEWQEQLDFKIISSPTPDQYEQGVFEWQISAVAKKSGELVLPAVQVVFEKIAQKSSFFMFNARQQVSLFSNMLKLLVIDLPPTKEPCFGIGHFTAFKMQIDQTDLVADKLAHLSLELTGDSNCNWSDLPKLELVNLPKKLQVYRGVISEQDNAKTFEFILQGIEVGKCVIPAQVFTFFNPKTRQYEKLKTADLDVNISSVYQVNNEPVLVDHQDQDRKVIASERLIGSIIENGPVRYLPFFYLDFRIFVFLILLPVVFLFLTLIVSFMTRRFANSPKKQALILEKQLLLIIKNNQPELLYDFFVQKAGFKYEFVMDNLFKKAANHEQLKQDFIIFYEQIASFRFANSCSLNNDSQALFAQAHAWLIILQELKLKC